MNTYRSATLLIIGGLSLMLLTGCSHTRTASTEDGSTASEDEVNVGYGTQDERTVTGSVASVSAKETEDYPALRVEELLQGRVAGARVTQLPGGGISIQIRGRNSILGSSEPLYVVDGMAVKAGPNGALRGMSPGEIDKIEVLKDAAATAIYGSRGANGVVLVTTKRGDREK